MAVAYGALAPHSLDVETVADLDRFIDEAEAQCAFPIAISLEAHEYRADLLVGHEKSFVHMTPLVEGKPYHVTVGDMNEGGVDFWLHSAAHSWFPARYLVEKDRAREAFCEFFQSGRLSKVVKWEDYYA